MVAASASAESYRAAAQAQQAVAGEFAYSQSAVTSADDIRGVFCVAARTLCASMPDYGVSLAKQAIAVSGGKSFVATVDEMASASEEDSFLLACVCASNVAGGGAAANAQVQGVKLAAVDAQAGVL